MKTNDFFLNDFFERLMRYHSTAVEWLFELNINHHHHHHVLVVCQVFMGYGEALNVGTIQESLLVEHCSARSISLISAA